MSDIVVVGSINTDLVVMTPRMPATGETVVGREFHTIPGGKGANQAFGAGRLGADTALVGCVGGDAFGDASIANLVSAGVDVRFVRRAGGASGVALIVVDGKADNTIVIVPGANKSLAPEDIDAAAPLFAGAKVLLVQLEVPLPAVERAMRAARANGAAVVLDPAPARTLPDELLALADYITPNQIESECLTGMRVADPDSARRAGRELLARGAGCALIKLGAKGVLALTEGGEDFVPGHAVRAVDTTAAGDSFSAGLGAALARGDDPRAAVRYANAVAALSVTRLGAQSSMPTACEVGDFLKSS